MARFQPKHKQKPSAKPCTHKSKQQADGNTTGGGGGGKIPRSLVFSRGKVPALLKQLQMDLRKLMLPYTALKLGTRRRDSLKVHLNFGRQMGITHLLMLSKTETSSYLRVARMPQGPTLTFNILEYALITDIANSQLHHRCHPDLFRDSPLIVLSGFGTGEEHLRLVTIMFQNIFSAIDIKTVRLSSCQRIVLLHYDKETKKIDFRHYSIRLQPVGVNRRIRKFVQNHRIPDLKNLRDVSDFVTRSGCVSESEADDDEAATVTLTTTVNRVNRASAKSAVRLQEIGPRMTLQLLNVEEGLCSGAVIFKESAAALS